jgi:hemolysin III
MAVAGIFLVASLTSYRARFSVSIYVLTMIAMLVCSTAYHRAKVTEQARLVLRKLDHSMISVAVAGSFTPVIVLTLHGLAVPIMLAVMWAGALGSSMLGLLWFSSPSWLRALNYCLLVTSGLAITPYILSRDGAAVFSLIIIGLAVYVSGAVTYALRRPNLRPGVYGFHELFHTLVMIALLSHFVAILILGIRS